MIAPNEKHAVGSERGSDRERYLKRIARIYLQSMLRGLKDDRRIAMEKALKHSPEELEKLIGQDLIAQAIEKVYQERGLATTEFEKIGDLALYPLLRKAGVFDALKERLGRKSDAKILAGQGSGRSGTSAVGGAGSAGSVKSGSGRTYAPGEIERLRAVRDALRRQDEGRQREGMPRMSGLQKKVLAGVLAGAGLVGAYFGARSAFGGNEPARIAETEVYENIYGLNTKNWKSNENREKHLRNLEGLVSQIGVVEGAKEDIGRYLNLVKEKDPEFYSKLNEFLDQLKIKYKVKN
jgi:hypothetical protein